MHVLAVGKCWSSGGRMVTVGMGWNPSSLAGNAGEPVQKYNSSWRADNGICSTTVQNQRLNSVSFSVLEPLRKCNKICLYTTLIQPAWIASLWSWLYKYECASITQLHNVDFTSIACSKAAQLCSTIKLVGNINHAAGNITNPESLSNNNQSQKSSNDPLDMFN